MEFIEEDGADAGQSRVGLEEAEKESLGDEADARFVADPAVVAGLVADEFADRTFEFGGDAVGDQAGGQAAGLEDDDLADDLGVAEEDLRDLGGFSGAGGSGEDQAIRPGEVIENLRFGAVDGEHYYRKRVTFFGG